MNRFDSEHKLLYFPEMAHHPHGASTGRVPSTSRTNYRRGFSFWICHFSLLLLVSAVFETVSKVDAQLAQSNSTKNIRYADVSFLKDMPAPSRVLADMQGSNSDDTAAKQRGAFGQLITITMRLIGQQPGSKFTSPELEELNKSYLAACKGVPIPTFDAKETERLAFQSPRAKWVERELRYERGARMEEEILKRYFSSDLQARYALIKQAEKDARAQDASQHAVDMRRDLAQIEKDAKAKQAQWMAQQGAGYDEKLKNDPAFRKEVEQQAERDRENLLKRRSLIRLRQIGIVGFVLVGLILFIIRVRKPAKVRQVVGIIEVLGQHQLNMEHGVRYALIKFLIDAGKTELVKSVIVGNDIQNELTAGLEGVFCFYRFKEAWVLCGCNVEGRITVGDADMDPTAQYRKTALLLGILFILIGIPFIFLLGIGIISILFGVYYLAVPSIPAASAIEKALQRPPLVPLAR